MITRSTTDELPAIDVRHLARRGDLRGHVTLRCGGRSLSVSLTRTPCHLGGERAWFRCPSCGRRAAILYLGANLVCRQCLGLYYECQRSRGRWSALTKLQRLRVRLGGSANLTEPFPERPKYMRRRTYDRLRQQADALEAAYVEVMCGELKRLRGSGYHA